jgi:hypothetical protein
LSNDQGVIDEIKEEIKRFLKMKTPFLEPVGHSKGNPERTVFSHECIY